MADPISCDVHGDNAATFVCRHVAVSKQEGPVEGFECFIDDEGGWQAMCKACGDTMVAIEDDEAREAFASEICVMLCLGCFREAAAVNGVDIP